MHPPSAIAYYRREVVLNQDAREFLLLNERSLDPEPIAFIV